MSDSPLSKRYHDLDALRGWAMLLGIVLHAAWMMPPIHWGSPIHDSDSSTALFGLMWWIHMFRLQAFYLIAGFFANMVLFRKGQIGFIKHRLTRIGIPLLVGCAIIYPIWYIQDVWAGMLRGRILTDEGFWTVFREKIGTSLKETVNTFHLWFLYDLMLLYAATLLVRFVFLYIVDRKERFSSAVQRAYRWLMHSPINILLLAIPSTLCLLPMKWWSGIEGYPIWFKPDWGGILSYWLFFAVGWLLYSQRDVLKAFDRRWAFNLVSGTAVSILLFTYYSTFLYHNVTPLYPVIGPEDVAYEPLRGELLAASAEPGEHPLGPVWEALTPLWREFLTSHASATPDQLAGVADELTKRVISGDGFASLDGWGLASSRVSVADLGRLDAPERNRKILEQLLPGAIAARITDQPWMKGRKVLFSAGYALGMWLLVFGCMGFFRRFCARPSPAMRYLADSSYCLYILHLNVLFQLGIFTAGVSFGWPLKFAFYNVAAVAIMIPIYHYCVRSTFIGQVLNGRRHPYAPLLQSPLFDWRFGRADETSEISPPHFPGEPQDERESVESQPAVAPGS